MERHSRNAATLFRVATTASQYYFAFIGRMSHSAAGRRILDKNNFLPW
jgi:hypothetical protein